MQTQTHIAVTSNPPLVETKPTLDIVNEQLHAGRIAQPLDLLFEDLSERRQEDPQDWPGYARSCLGHPLRSLLHQDPFTYRAFAKPRGYAGDAVMMDYIYGLGKANPAARDASPLGRAIFQYMGTRPSAKAVRYRRQLLAKMVDQVADRGGSSVLAIAAGHLREVELSTAVHAGKLEEYVAFDQDEASLTVVDRDYAHLGVRTMPGSVRQILAGKAKLGEYDLVYAAGLYDYLSEAAAVALTRRMFAMTRPGGRMLIPNFLAGARDTGYMESFMDWHLIYRNHADMQRLADALPRAQVADRRIFDDPDGTITFLLVSRADEAL
jgi:extracellular factor (EF) 3-hydroxypalmitic acid methyl ester biosynthesis protein